MRSFFLTTSLFVASMFVTSAPLCYADMDMECWTGEPFEALLQYGFRLDNHFDSLPFTEATWGVYVETLDGQVLYDNNGDKCLTPASNLKLLTTAAALDILGGEYTYDTVVKAVGEIDKDGVLQGDLVIIGSGDPTLGAWHPEKDKNSDWLLEQWGNKLKEAGIKKINGRIIGDGRCFTEEYISGMWDYEDLPYWYAAGSSGLAMEENCFRIDIIAGENAGDPTSLKIIPDTSYVSFINNSTTVEAGGKSNADILWRETEGYVYRVERTIAVDKKVIHERGSVWDGARYAAYLMKESLEKNGIDVSGEAYNIRELPSKDPLLADKYIQGKVLIVHTSPTMKEICFQINNLSHNFFADQVLRTLGMEVKHSGSFESGCDAVKEWFTSKEVPRPETLKMYDGSGLSSGNVIQARQMVEMLRVMKNDSPAGNDFYESLSICGKDGYLKKRMGEEAMAGRVRAKTGYILNARSLSGYIKLADGQEACFSMICNNQAVSSSTVDKAIDNALRIVAGVAVKK